VLRFLGSTNALTAGLTFDRGPGARVRLGTGLEFRLDSVPEAFRGQSTATVYLRTQDIDILFHASAVHTSAPAVVTLCTYLGAHERIVAKLGDQQIVVDRSANGGDHKELPVGTEFYLDFKPARCRFG
jgi:hypothetical protein